MEIALWRRTEGELFVVSGIPIQNLNGLLDMARGQVSIPHRCLDISVTEMLLDGSQVNSLHDHMGGEGMSQCVESHVRDARFLDRFVEATTDIL